MEIHLFSKKNWEIVIKNRALRTVLLLCIIFIILGIIFLSLNLSYQKKINENNDKIAAAQQTLTNLQYLATTDDEIEEIEQEIENDLFRTKSFVGYEEVIPFIAMLESLFTTIDPKAEITIKSREEQIFIDHFADYAVYLKINKKKNLFLKALDELYNSRFITKITDFTVHYKADEETEKNEMNEVEFVIRLYLN